MLYLHDANIATFENKEEKSKNVPPVLGIPYPPGNSELKRNKMKVPNIELGLGEAATVFTSACRHFEGPSN